MPWIAPVVGGAVGLLSSSMNKSGSTTSSNAPWAGAQPALQDVFNNALALYNEGGFPRDAQSMLRARGMAGSPVTRGAQDLATSTMRGDYLNSNPFLDQAISRASGEAQSRVNSQFGPFNNYGSSAHQEQMGRGIMEAALPYLSQNYENERGRQFAAMSQAPALAGMDYQDLGAVNQAAFMPWDWLGRYQQTISGANPGGGQTTTPYFTNPVNSALGGAMLGNQLYNSYTNPNSSWMNMGSSTPFAGGAGWGNV